MWNSQRPAGGPEHSNDSRNHCSVTLLGHQHLTPASGGAIWVFDAYWITVCTNSKILKWEVGAEILNRYLFVLFHFEKHVSHIEDA